MHMHTEVFGSDCLSVVDVGTHGSGTWKMRVRSESDERNSGSHSAVGRMSGS